jgi:hypothetical protein
MIPAVLTLLRMIQYYKFHVCLYNMLNSALPGARGCGRLLALSSTVYEQANSIDKYKIPKESPTRQN